jgi:hypothetical protein
MTEKVGATKPAKKTSIVIDTFKNAKKKERLQERINNLPDSNSSLSDLKLAVSKSDIYQDLDDFKNLNQLELSKKIPKWKKIRDEITHDKDGNLVSEAVKNIYRKDHTMKYCKECDPNTVFFFDTQLDSTNHWRPWRKYSPRFWTEYSAYYKNILLEAEAFYLAKKAEIEEEVKAKKSEALKTEIECGCGGHYSARNKAKHVATKKHVQWLSENVGV